MLEGIRVVDLSSVLAGPLTGSFLAELGATVIKVENKKTGGDVTRQWKLAAEDPSSPYSAYYFSANYGKETHLLDLTSEEDRAWLWNQMESADIVISNFQKSTAEKLGLAPDEVLQRYPGIVFAQLSAYEWDDPRPGYDLIMQAETGWIAMTGTDTEHLAKLPVALMDILASHQMREGILLALWQRARNGTGSAVHVSLYKSAVAALANQASNYLMSGHIPQPMGTLHPNIMPYGDIYSTRDAVRLILAVGSDLQFEKLITVLSIPSSMVSDFLSNRSRVIQRTDVSRLLQQYIETFSWQELSEMLARFGIPFCRICNLEALFETSIASSMIKERRVDDVSARSVSTVAFKISSFGKNS